MVCDELRLTIEKNYPDLIVVSQAIKNTNWDRVYNVNTTNAKKKKIQKRSEDDKTFLVIQKCMIMLGNFINGSKCDTSKMLEHKTSGKDYDELITNIKWCDHKSMVKFMEELDKLCSSIFVNLYDGDNQEITIRSNTRRLLKEILGPLIGGSDSKLLDKISNEIETSIMLYSLLIVSEIRDGDLRSLDWTCNFLRAVYLTKANCIVCSLSNNQYNDVFVKGLVDETIHPLSVSFIKRSQILSKLYEVYAENKLKMFEENNLHNDDDYKSRYSTIRCPQCKLNHTSFTQLQTRSADEPMTIFWHCHKCHINGRK